MTTQTPHISHATALLLAVAALLLTSETVSFGVEAVRQSSALDPCRLRMAGQALRSGTSRARQLRRSAHDVHGHAHSRRAPQRRRLRLPLRDRHQVPDYTAVYPVRSGTARVLGGHNIAVDSGARSPPSTGISSPPSTPERHPSIQPPRRVPESFEHVHFAESTSGAWVNPLAAGHITPYTDTKSPSVQGITFRADHAAPDLLPEYVHGRVSIVAEASDQPSQSVPGLWHGLPVAPARITWRIERARDGKVVVPTRTTFDITSSLPDPTTFWSHYARGTRQISPRSASSGHGRSRAPTSTGSRPPASRPGTSRTASTTSS